MAERNRPLSKESAPDPARSYERADPNKEGGMGRLDNNVATPLNVPDSIQDGTPNKQIPEHQLNAEDVVDEKAKRSLHQKS
ncbi:MAG TPA: hypothetical protein VFC46_17810 [Humisphaera sp.]|nr:hypothetical protein [Humisphaera sp.]